MITKQQFMEYFRSDAASEELTPEDCIELFRGALKGQSDLTKELLESVCDDYDTTLGQVLYLKEGVPQNIVEEIVSELSEHIQREVVIMVDAGFSDTQIANEVLLQWTQANGFKKEN
jgi:hypothetical protein